MTETNKESIVKDNPKVGLCSRIDYGSKGFRRGILEAGYEHFKREGVHFIVLLGGLVSQKAIAQRVKDYIKIELRKDKVKNVNYANLKRFTGLLKNEYLAARKAELKIHYLNKIARELAKLIPAINVTDPEEPAKTKCVDLYIVTSPAYDGEEGEIIAHILSMLRDDVRVYNAGGDRIDVKYVNKMFWALTPQKAVWMRGDYYSTAVERVIKDKIKSTSQSSPELYVVGCFGSSINKPLGELKYRYVSIPNFSRIEETRVSENQIGVSVLEFPLDGGQYLFRTHSLKDLVGHELRFITPPPKCSELQKMLIEVIKYRGWATAGIFRTELKKTFGKDATREEVVEALQRLDKKKTIRRKGENWPGIVYQEGSQKYYFDLDWIQRLLRYEVVQGPYAEVRMVNAACLHAGSIETDYPFIVNELPEIILKSGATILDVVGDIKEGLEHNLDKKGEIIAGANNNTVQDKLAAVLIGIVVWKVFFLRFNAMLDKKKAESDVPLTPDELSQMIFDCLIYLIYWLGNHDCWESAEGHSPLEVFHSTLIDFLIERIEKHISALSVVPTVSVREHVRNKVLRREFFELPSGLKVSNQHPFMSRAKTTSIRPQEMLDYAKRHGCQVAIGGNFHVGENIEEWDQDLGQCVSQEIGTAKHGSNFERRKMKLVDQGVGYLRIVSKDKRILMTESAYYGAKNPSPPIDNLQILNAWVEKIGIPPVPGISIAGEPLK